jgi:hypothetical protein
MTRPHFALLAAVSLSAALVPARARAQDAAPPPVPEAESAPAAAAPAVQTIEAIVRGLYLEGRIGGGYMLVSADVSAAQQQLYGVRSEDLGPGAMVQLAVGYDLTQMIAVQAVAGASLISGTRRREPVRDLSLAFGGAGVRLAFDLTERIDLLAAVAVAFVNAANSVEDSKNGVGVLGEVGLEYYVHIRHFSVGIDLSLLAPVGPVRMFLAVSPTLKYTF